MSGMKSRVQLAYKTKYRVCHRVLQKVRSTETRTPLYPVDAEGLRNAPTAPEIPWTTVHRARNSKAQEAEAMMACNLLNRVWCGNSADG